MNTYETLKVNQDGNVLTIKINRIDHRNAINMQMVNDLSDVVKKADDAEELSVVVIRGRHDIFSSGIDLRDFTPEKQPDIYGFQKWEKMCELLNRLNKLTIAVVQGECNGGGFDLFLNCDFRIAEKKTIFRLDEIKMGFIPGMTTFRMAKYIGLGRAKKLILSCQPIPASTALEWGLVDAVCEPHELDEVIQKTVEDFLPLRPVPLLLARRLLGESFSESYEDFIGHYLAAQHRAINSEDFMKLVRESSSKD